ncbi:hypothetical protein ACFVJ8_02255 [Streptomyces yangpuensis]|uniref:hypothetical protein n=1 Tax=Streptomyces TaxID=1883 RepID=UPI0004CC4F4A|nr:hypothetical protein [Streptomyces sp. NRRL S-378]
MKINRKKAAGVMAGLALLGVTGAAPAHAAEGQFESYLSGWNPGQESRRWYDNNNTGDYTGIYFQGCSAGHDFSFARLSLWVDRPSLPDSHKGTENNYCGWVDYGNPGRGTFYFKMDDVLNGYPLNVDYVKVAW